MFIETCNFFVRLLQLVKVYSRMSDFLIISVSGRSATSATKWFLSSKIVSELKCALTQMCLDFLIFLPTGGKGICRFLFAREGGDGRSEINPSPNTHDKDLLCLI